MKTFECIGKVFDIFSWPFTNKYRTIIKDKCDSMGPPLGIWKPLSFSLSQAASRAALRPPIVIMKRKRERGHHDEYLWRFQIHPSENRWWWVKHEKIGGIYASIDAIYCQNPSVKRWDQGTPNLLSRVFCQSPLLDIIFYFFGPRPSKILLPSTYADWTSLITPPMTVFIHKARNFEIIL